MFARHLCLAAKKRMVTESMSGNWPGRHTFRMQRVMPLTTSATMWQDRTPHGRRPKAVIFDLAGVIFPSPARIFSEFEVRFKLPPGLILRSLEANGETGAWAQLERGEITEEEFLQPFSEECSKQLGQKVDMTPFWYKINHYFESATPYPEMLDAIRCIRAEGIKAALLTNNWQFYPHNSCPPVEYIRDFFDVVVESYRVNMRKPNKDIYQHTLGLLDVPPQDAIFLDDLGPNLKGASEIGIRTIKVNDQNEALRELEGEIGFGLKGYAPGTVAVPDRLQISIEKLHEYFRSILSLHSDEPPTVRYYEHGQSNPTYFVTYAGRNLVLRKKPPGKLLPSAHAVEREYRIMKAVKGCGVPVPHMFALCEDDSVLGTPFYIMEHIEGRIFKDPTLPGMSPVERQQVYTAMVEVLSRIHQVNIEAAGLGDFAKQGGYMRRNFDRWTKQYEKSKTGDIPAMDRLQQWLPERIPLKEACTVVHGDFRLDNLIFHPHKLEVVAVIDWEMSTLGDPLADLAANCMPHFYPPESRAIPVFTPLSDIDLKALGIPTLQEYTQMYHGQLGDVNLVHFNFYVAYCFYRSAAVLQGVYKRSLQGQASSSSAQQIGSLASLLANVGWNIASESDIAPTVVAASGSTVETMAAAGRCHGTRSYSTSAKAEAVPSSGGEGRVIPGSLPLSVQALSPRVQNIHQKVMTFVQERIIPLESEFEAWCADPKTKWSINPKIEALKTEAKAAGLWNLFLPLDSDPEVQYGAGLTNVEYAYICEEMGQSIFAPEVFNCSAPDTGNMEVLIRYGSEEQKARWLPSMLDGTVHSCFGMTEPKVASSDATNITASIVRDGDEYVINGHKWWSSGACDPRCKLCIFMGKTDPSAAKHRQQSMILVPMDSPGVKIIRPLTVLGFDDAPHGHPEIVFDNVRVPVGNLLVGEGRGFEIAQGRLGPGRIHHCMRLIGAMERTMYLMAHRVQERVAFGKPLAAQSSMEQHVAQSRAALEQSRLLVLKTAHMMDTVGNRVAAPEIAMIKMVVPRVAQEVIDNAIQAFGGMGVSGDVPLARFYSQARILRLADGPDEVHMRTVASFEYRKHKSKL